MSFFDKQGQGDYGDWDAALNGFPQVQNGASTSGVQLDLDRTEWITLDVVGYNVDSRVTH